jgi:hypothetical protein
MADNAQSPFKPDQLLRGVTKIKIPHLERKSGDQFFKFPANKFKAEVLNGLKNIKDNSTRSFCVHLVEVIAKETKYDGTRFTALPTKTIAGIVNDFGEMLGALHLVTNNNIQHVIFPERGNYELVDFFVTSPKDELWGWSSKSASGASNTLKFGEILRKVDHKSSVFSNKEKQIIDLFQIINDNSTKMGVILAGSMIEPKLLSPLIVKKLNDKQPDLLATTTLNSSEKAIIVKLIQTKLHTTLKQSAADDYRLEDLTLIYEKIVNKYVADNSSDLTVLVKKLLPELNIIKFKLDKNNCSFSTANLTQVDLDIKSRSKNSYRRMSDKLGLQL